MMFPFLDAVEYVDVENGNGALEVASIQKSENNKKKVILGTSLILVILLIILGASGAFSRSGTTSSQLNITQLNSPTTTSTTTTKTSSTTKTHIDSSVGTQYIYLYPNGSEFVSDHWLTDGSEFLGLKPTATMKKAAAPLVTPNDLFLIILISYLI